MDIYKTHRFFSRNETGRDFVVGDLHGFLQKFINALNAVSFNPETDRIFSVGDLIDRGPNSLECLSLLNKPWFFAVRGNHEDMMVGALLRNDFRYLWYSNGGGWAKNYDKNILIEWAKIIDKLPVAITVETLVGRIGITHANPPDDWEDAINSPDIHSDRFMWSRSKIMYKDSTEIKNTYMTIHGHTHTVGIVQYGNSYFIDTLCNGDGEPTLMRIT